MLYLSLRLESLPTLGSRCTKDVTFLFSETRDALLPVPPRFAFSLFSSAAPLALCRCMCVCVKSKSWLPMCHTDRTLQVWLGMQRDKRGD